nr:hypothetical protein [Tanacetum cinerariifolium]
MTPIEFVIIDEATQLKECESVISLQLSGVRNAVLDGDERQLPSMVQSKDSDEKSVHNKPMVAMGECGEKSEVHWWRRVEKVVVGWRSRDIRRSTQNNGSSTPGENEGVYYGQLEEILEFAYTPFKVVLFRVKWFDTRNEGRRVKRFVTRNNITQIMTATTSYKDQPYISATQAKLVFYLEDPARQTTNLWKVIQDVNHRWGQNEVVIKDDSSSNLALSTNSNELNYANLNIAGQSMKVEALPPPVIPVDDNDDFIDEEDDVPYDLADYDDEVRTKHDMTSIARGHGGDGGGDPPQAPRRLGSRNTGKRDKRGVTGNYELKKAVEKYGPQEIEFEWKDQKRCCISAIIPAASFQDRPSPCWATRRGYQTRHRGLSLQIVLGQKNKYKQEMWTNKGGLGAVDQIRRDRPNDMTLHNWNKLVDSWIDSKKAYRAELNSHNRLANKIVSLQGSRSLAQSRHRYSQNHNEKYPSLIQSYYDLHTKKGVWRDDGSKALYEEMLRFQALGTMTERDILTQTQGMSQFATTFRGSTTESESLDGDDEDDGDVRDL